MQIIQMNNSDSNSRLRNMDNLTDMGFSSPNYSPIPTVGNKVPLQSTGRKILTSTPRKEE